MDDFIESVNDLNIMSMKMVAEKDPENVTNEMILALARNGVDKLKDWMESETIDYIIMNNLEEYSQYQLTQFYFLDEAFRCGIKVLLKDNDFNPVFPF